MITFELKAGESLPAAAQPPGCRVRMECGGEGVCGKCRIIARPQANLSPITLAEREHLTAGEIAAGFRLACQLQFRGPVVISVPETSLDRPDALGKLGVLAQFDPEPAVSRICLKRAGFPETPESTAGSLAEGIAQRAAAAGAGSVRFERPWILQHLSREGDADQDVTLVIHATRGVTAVLPGKRPQSLGIALDLGTTTLAGYLCDLTSGEMVAGASVVNPQRATGEDVISRIAHCNRQPEGLAQLRRMAADGIDQVIGECLGSAGGLREAIDAVMVAGNPVMEQILAGLHPRGIGVHPYRPTIRNFPLFEAADLELDLSPGTPVHFFPLVSGFVGGDTLAALLADGTTERETDTLLVDIGTNGEIVIGRGDRLWATSCATGPALEGARISCGMRAAAGAIDQVSLDSTGRIDCRVMGDGRSAPIGICGSGIIDAVAVLLRVGALQRDGRFNPDFPGVVCDANGLGRRFVLVPAGVGGGAEIFVSLQDVRQIQLAKAAMAAGIELLMSRVALRKLQRTVLTGAFGARFDWRSAVSIGMLPEAVSRGAVESKVNLAGMGAAMALVNQSHARRAREIQARIRFIELAGEPAFAGRFVQATAFPDPAAFRHLWG